jgi:hypothetical protein
MGQKNHQPDFQIIYNDNRLASLFQSLDELHTAASEGNLDTITPLANAELMSWLQELIYTAEETLVEINNHETRPDGSHLRLVK